MKVVVDINEFESLVDEEFKWDKAHKEECGWSDNDIAMIAEGMKEATNKITEMVYARKTAQKVVQCKDCKFFYNDGYQTRCSKWGIYMDDCACDEDEFCSRGETR